MSDRLKVLIVEDSPSDVELMLYELRRSGFDPQWQQVDNEADYVEQLREDLQIILADYSLPQFDALRALSALKAQEHDIPLIVLTGTVTEEVAVDVMRRGAADYLLKDRTTRLGEAVRHALAEKQLRDAKRNADEALRRYATELEQLVEERTAQVVEAKEYVEAILSNTSDAIILTSVTGVVQQVNPAFEALAPAAARRAVGAELWSLIAPEYVSAVHDAFRTLIGERQTARLEIQVEGVSGSRRDVDLSLDLILQNADVRGVVCSLRDVTARRRAERALNESEARYRRLSENAQDLIFHYRLVPTMGFEYVNPVVQTMLGYTPDEFYADPDMAAKLIFPDDMQRMFELNRGLESVITPEVLRWQRRDGEVIYIELRTVPILDDDSRLVAVEGIGRDVTERNRREEELRALLAKERELNELKQRFVSMVSHEFRTPLSMIQVSSDLLKLYGDRLGPNQQLERLQNIQAQVKHLVTLLDDILALSRAESFGVDFNPEATDLDALCAGLIEEMQTIAGDHAFEYTIDDACVPISLDPKLIRQALSNLLSNALKYSPEGSHVYVDVRCEPTQVVIRVRDEGIGIPADDLAHMFEVFHRAQNVGAIPGTGLGLPIVRSAVHAHGGTVDVESELGVGSTFSITLPLISDRNGFSD